MIVPLPGSRLMKIPWELLESCKQLNYPVVYRKLGPAMDRKEHMGFASSEATKRAVRVLFISARPNGINDLGHRVLSRPLLEFCSKLKEHGAQVNVHLVQPGSWKAFCDHLDEVFSRYGKGFYDMVHIDVHGIVSNGEYVYKPAGPCSLKSILIRRLIEYTCLLCHHVAVAQSMSRQTNLVQSYASMAFIQLSPTPARARR